MMDLEIKRLGKLVSDKDKEISDLLVLIDTLQTNLRAAVSHIPESERGAVTGVRSFKWSLNWGKSPPPLLKLDMGEPMYEILDGDDGE